MSDREQQSEFVYKLSQLIRFVYCHLHYELTFGDAWSKPKYGAHKPGSYHYRRLAIDMNLFIDGVYQRSTEAHRVIGEFWENIGGTWGGRWGDGNHYSWGET